MFLKDILKLTFASLILLVSCVNPSYSGSTTNPVYSGSGGSVGPPGPALSTDDEGVQVEATTSTMNFTGAGVTATGAGNTVTVAIPGGGTGSGATTNTSGVIHSTANPGTDDFAIGGKNNIPGDPDQASIWLNSNGNITLNVAGAGIDTVPALSTGEALVLEELGNGNGDTFTLQMGATDLTTSVTCTVQADGSLDAQCPWGGSTSSSSLDGYTEAQWVSLHPTGLLIKCDNLETVVPTGGYHYIGCTQIRAMASGDAVKNARTDSSTCLGGPGNYPCQNEVVFATGGTYQLSIYTSRTSLDVSNFCALTPYLNNADLLMGASRLFGNLADVGSLNWSWGTTDVNDGSRGMESYNSVKFLVAAGHELGIYINATLTTSRINGCSWADNTGTIPGFKSTDLGMIYIAVQKI